MFVNNLICLNRIIKKMRLKIINFKIHKIKFNYFFIVKYLSIFILFQTLI
jgi:hypothetical protein